MFWSERGSAMPGVLARGLPAWRAEARPLAGAIAPLLDRVDHSCPRPTGTSSCARRTGWPVPGAAVLVGDAAHAMSPQLGTGTSLALADAWTLHHALATPDLAAALGAYAAARAAHVRWYQWWTRLMMPVFQSSLTPLGWPRDLVAPYVMKVPGVIQAVTTLLGDRTSPWSTWRLPELP